MNNKFNAGKTERGFDFVSFKDRYDFCCSLQKSSLASENCVWLGVAGNRMHLSQEMARYIGEQLLYFAEKGELNVKKN